LIVLAILSLLGGWYTDGYWQAVFIEFGFGLALFVALEIIHMGGVLWQVPTFVPLIMAWFVDNSFWQSILITIGSTYILASIAMGMEDYIPPYLEDLSQRDPYRPEIEEINHPGQVRQVTLTGFALHEFDEFQRAKRREYQQWLQADLRKRTNEYWLTYRVNSNEEDPNSDTTPPTDAVAEDQKEEPVRTIRFRRKRRGPIPVRRWDGNRKHDL
jgi:hypothetical protein